LCAAHHLPDQPSFRRLPISVNLDWRDRHLERRVNRDREACKNRHNHKPPWQRTALAYLSQMNCLSLALPNRRLLSEGLAPEGAVVPLPTEALMRWSTELIVDKRQLIRGGSFATPHRSRQWATFFAVGCKGRDPLLRPWHKIPLIYATRQSFVSAIHFRHCSH